MKKANKTKLKKAADLVDQAHAIVSSMMQEYFDGAVVNDEFYGLQDFQLRLDELGDELRDAF